VARSGSWAASATVLAGLAAIVGLRWVAVNRGADALGTGSVFAVALLALWLVAARRHRQIRLDGGRRAAMALVAGIAFGFVLVLVMLGGTTLAGVVLPRGLAHPAAPFAPWAIVTVAVAAAEEGILRGVLLDRLRAAGGLPVAIAITTLAFALIHVPLYGWHVVPLDLAVGLGLAGLRLATRSIVAPAAAHAVADLATWWL
jgi:membrane protease YdiL (CAAX protease family)